MLSPLWDRRRWQGLPAITVLNQLLLIMYRYFIDWERLCTVTDVARSQLWKLFLAQFVNTGFWRLLCMTF